MLDKIYTVARLISVSEVKPYNSSLGNLLVILYILFVNLRASFQTGKSSNDLIVAKCEFLSGINRPIFQSANLPIYRSKSKKESTNRPIYRSAGQFS